MPKKFTYQEDEQYFTTIFIAIRESQLGKQLFMETVLVFLVQTKFASETNDHGNLQRFIRLRMFEDPQFHMQTMNNPLWVGSTCDTRTKGQS